MMKKLKIFALLSALALGITSCSANAAPLPYSQDDVEAATIDTPWVDYSVPATEISFADGQEHKILNKGETYQYIYTLSPSSASDAGVKWESSNVSVATVSKGVVTAHNAGVATISVRNIETDELFKTLAVTVNVPIEDFSLSEESITLKYNQNYQINVSALPEDTTELGFAYSSNNEAVASVSDSGLVTTHEIDGEAIISVTSPYLNKVASLNVTVGITHVESVTIAPLADHTLEVNNTVQLSASVLPENAEIKGVTFESSNEEIASVSGTGLVTGLKEGNVTIYARSEEKPLEKFDSIDLAIYEVKATSVSIGEGDIELSNPGVPTYQLTAVYYNGIDVIAPSKTNGHYSTSDASIANVSQNGLVTMFAKGEATITYEDSYAGIMAQRIVKCVANATSVVITGNSKVAVGEEITLSALVTPSIETLSHGEAVTFTQISGESYASFTIKNNTSITVTGLARGKASFVATYGQVNSNEFTVQIVEDRIIYLNTNNLLEEADAVVFAHYWNEEGLAGTVKFNKVVGQDIIYTAAIDGEATSFMVVRCAAGAVDIIWNNPETGTGNVWGQSGNIAISEDYDMWTVTNYTESMIYGSYVENFDPSKTYTAEEPQELPTGFGLIINHLDTVKGVDQGEVDVYGITYHQYFLEKVEFKKDDIVQLYDFEHASAWAVNIDSSSFDGEFTKYISYNSYDENFYTILKDFSADVYIKLRYEADVIYFGLIDGGGEEPPVVTFEPHAIYGLGQLFDNVKLADNPANENEWYLKLELEEDGLEVKFNLAAEDKDWRGYSDLKANITVSISAGDNDNIKFASKGVYEFFIAKTKSDGGSIWIQEYDDTPVIDEKITIYYNNVNNWSDVNAYAWSSKGNNGWPGEVMTLVEGSESVYEIELSKSYVNIIFNNGVDQTTDLTIDQEHPYYNNGVWMDYSEEGGGQEEEKLYQVKFNDGELVTLSKQILPNDAPEGLLAKYSVNTNVVKDDEFWFFVDGVEIQSIHANSDGEEVYNNYVVDVDKLLVQADAEDALVELNVYGTYYSFWIAGGVSANHVKESEEKMTIYYNNISGWDKVYAYVWNDVINNTWPGAEMTLVEGSIYSIEISQSYDHIIFNDGSGQQTPDLDFEEGKDYYDNGAWTVYDPSVPEPLKVSESSLLLPQNSSATVAVSGGVGEISVNSNNKSVANVSISGNTITVTTGNVVSAATITVSDEGGNEVIFTVTIGYEFTISWDADWIYNDNAVVYAYAWTDGESNQAWYKTVKVSNTSLKVVLPVSNNRLILGRFSNSIDVKDASFDNKWNQTSDIIFSQGTFAYTATW